MLSRRFLVYCAVGGTDWKPDLFGADREFDVALNNYRGTDLDSPAEYLFKEKTHKLLGASRNLPKIGRHYEAYAFLDDDIEVRAADLNRLFKYGITRCFQLWQPALTPNSHYSHKWTLQAEDHGFRYRPTVEMMTPFFSRAALEKCLESFGEVVSGWGVDMEAWPALLGTKNIAVIDEVPVRHARPVSAVRTELAHGFHPHQEWAFMTRKYGSLVNRLTYRLRPGRQLGRADFSFRKLPHLKVFVLPKNGTASVELSRCDNWTCVPPGTSDAKLQVIVQALRENTGEIVLFAESGVRFRQPMGLVVFTAIEGRDMAFSPGKEGAPLDLSFMALRSVPRVIEFWEGLLSRSEEAGPLPLAVAERLETCRFSGIRWGRFPELEQTGSGIRDPISGVSVSGPTDREF